MRKGQSHEQNIRSIIVRQWDGKGKISVCPGSGRGTLPCVSKASVSIAVRQLRDQGLIDVEPDGSLLFTVTGKNRSDQLGERVSFFRQLLTDAGVEPSQALRDAIFFSREMSEASFEAFRTKRTG